MARRTRKILRVEYLPRNEQGRDFVVGDLHGEASYLDALLDRVRFDAAADRLFSVGDLVDRGPEPERCLRLLDAPWFHAVLGNHDAFLAELVEVMLDRGGHYSEEAKSRVLAMALGGMDSHWAIPDLAGEHPDREKWFAFADCCARLPHVIVVGRGSADRFNIVHAALSHRHRLLTDERLDKLAGTAVAPSLIENCLWNRSLASDLRHQLDATERIPPRKMVKRGLSLTYCGHNVLPLPVQFRSHLHIDTGAGYRWLEGPYGLTLIEHATTRLWQARYPQTAANPASLAADAEPSA